MSGLPFRSYGAFLRELFPGRKETRKVVLDAGFRCPNLDGTRGTGGCSYCDNRSFSPVAGTRKSVAEQLDEGIARLKAKRPDAGVLAYLQPWTNTYGPLERLRALYESVLADERVDGLAIGTRPDCVDEGVRDLLEELAARKPMILELGLQSANDRTLERIGRGHTAAEWAKAWSLFRDGARAKNSRVALAAHVILGLPGETPEDWRATARFLAAHPVESVKIHPLHVVKGTRLTEEWERGEFALPTLEEYARGVAEFASILPRSTAVERVSGEAPSDMLLAPAWSGDRNAIVRAVLAALGEVGKESPTGAP